MKKILLNQISNPGISFTKDVNDKMISLYVYLNENKNNNCSYQDFQKDLIEKNIFSGSYIRSFIPFLYNTGMINNYNENIKYSNFFTKNGALYVKTIFNIKQGNDNNIDIEKLVNIKNDLLCMSLDYMIKNNYKFYDKYLDILKFVKEYKTINREEFYILEYCLQNNIDYHNDIENYRSNNSYDIYIKSNNEEILSYRSNNAFNYLVAFLADDQCNYIKKADQSNYRLNYDRELFIDSVLEQVRKEGSTNE